MRISTDRDENIYREGWEYLQTSMRISTNVMRISRQGWEYLPTGMRKSTDRDENIYRRDENRNSEKKRNTLPIPKSHQICDLHSKHRTLNVLEIVGTKRGNLLKRGTFSSLYRTFGRQGRGLLFISIIVFSLFMQFSFIFYYSFLLFW